MRRAFSLVEAVLAGTILLLALLPILAVFGTSGMQGRQTSDQGLTLALLQKTSEELRLAAWENPGVSVPLQANADLGVPRRIVDGGSPFYRTLEDQREPFGLTQDGVDPGITSDFAALYREVSTHRLGLTAVPTPLTTGVATDVNLAMAWNGFRDVDQQLDLAVRLPGRVHLPRPVAGYDFDELDRRGAELLYPGRPGTLAALAAASGGDLTTVRALAHLSLMSAAFAATQRDARVALDAAVAAAGPGARGTLTAARLHEARAAQTLALVVLMAPHAAALAAPGAAARLGTPPPPVGRYRLGLIAAQALPAAFIAATGAARDAYAAAASPPLSAEVSPRTRQRILNKLVEILKLRTLTGAPGELAVLHALLDQIRAEQAGRNPNFVAEAVAESERSFDLATLAATYAGGEPVEFARFRDGVAALAPLMPGLP